MVDELFFILILIFQVKGGRLNVRHKFNNSPKFRENIPGKGAFSNLTISIFWCMLFLEICVAANEMHFCSVSRLGHTF